MVDLDTPWLRMLTNITDIVVHCHPWQPMPSQKRPWQPITPKWSPMFIRCHPLHFMVPHGHPWHCHGRPWPSVVTHDYIWLPVATHVGSRHPKGTAMVFSWSSVATHGIAFVAHRNPWSLMASHDTTIIVHGNPRSAHGNPWHLRGHPWPSVAIENSPWQSMALPQLTMATHGRPWKPVAT